MGSVRDKKKKLADYVIEEIKEMLRNGVYKEGDKLPNQLEFARDLGVSRLSLREAPATLSSIGVVEQRPRTGTVILSGNPDLWMESLKAPMLSEQKATRELLAARKIVELPMIRHALSCVDSSLLEKAKAALQDMKEARESNDTARFQKAYTTISLRILEATKNRYIVYTYLNAHSLLEQLVDELIGTYPKFFDDVYTIFDGIIQALAKDDAREAYRLYKKFLDQEERLVEKHYART